MAAGIPAAYPRGCVFRFQHLAISISRLQIAVVVARRRHRRVPSSSIGQLGCRRRLDSTFQLIVVVVVVVVVV